MTAAARVGIVVLASAVLGSLPAANAAILCARQKADGTFNSSVRIREACKSAEVQLDPAALGLQGPQGATGATGAPGGPVTNENVYTAVTSVRLPAEAILGDLNCTVFGLGPQAGQRVEAYCDNPTDVLLNCNAGPSDGGNGVVVTSLRGESPAAAPGSNTPPNTSRCVGTLCAIFALNYPEGIAGPDAYVSATCLAVSLTTSTTTITTSTTTSTLP